MTEDKSKPMFIWVVVAVEKDVSVTAATTNVFHIPATNGNDALNKAQAIRPNDQVFLVHCLSANELGKLIDLIE